MTTVTRIEGGCHCGNIRYVLEWPADVASIATRVCGCSFCRKHGGRWTSHRDAALDAQIRDASQVSQYRFGTETADFFVCARCGAVPFVVSPIAELQYAVVNANTFESVDASLLKRSAVSFDGENTLERLERRARNWIRRVQIGSPGT
jgi:hypothetical protein